MKTVAIIGCGKRGTDKEGWAIGHAHAQGYLKSGHGAHPCFVDLLRRSVRLCGRYAGESLALMSQA